MAKVAPLVQRWRTRPLQVGAVATALVAGVVVVTLGSPAATAVASSVADAVRDPMSLLRDRSPGTRGVANLQTKRPYAHVPPGGRTTPGGPRERVLSTVRTREPELPFVPVDTLPPATFAVPDEGPTPGLGVTSTPGGGIPAVPGGGGIVVPPGVGGGGSVPPGGGTPPNTTTPPDNTTPPTDTPTPTPTPPTDTPTPTPTPPTDTPTPTPTPPTDTPTPTPTPPTDTPTPTPTPPTDTPTPTPTPPIEPPVPPIVPPVEPPPPEVPAVPEPATWLMMILGFGAVGVGLRRRFMTSADTATERLPSHD